MDNGLGKNIFVLRTRASLSAKGLSEKLGISEKQLFRWESGQKALPIAYINILAAVLGVPIDGLFNLEVSEEESAAYIGQYKDILSFKDKFLVYAKTAKGSIKTLVQKFSAVFSKVNKVKLSAVFIFTLISIATVLSFFGTTEFRKREWLPNVEITVKLSSSDYIDAMFGVDSWDSQKLFEEDEKFSKRLESVFNGKTYTLREFIRRYAKVSKAYMKFELISSVKAKDSYLKNGNADNEEYLVYAYVDGVFHLVRLIFVPIAFAACVLYTLFRLLGKKQRYTGVVILFLSLSFFLNIIVMLIPNVFKIAGADYGFSVSDDIIAATVLTGIAILILSIDSIVRDYKEKTGKPLSSFIMLILSAGLVISALGCVNQPEMFAKVNLQYPGEQEQEYRIDYTLDNFLTTFNDDIGGGYEYENSNAYFYWVRTRINNGTIHIDKEQLYTVISPMYIHNFEKTDKSDINRVFAVCYYGLDKIVLVLLIILAAKLIAGISSKKRYSLLSISVLILVLSIIQLFFFSYISYDFYDKIDIIGLAFPSTRPILLFSAALLSTIFIGVDKIHNKILKKYEE